LIVTRQVLAKSLLRASERISITVNDQIAAERLRRLLHDPRVLADGLAALLAKNADELDYLSGVFRGLYSTANGSFTDGSPGKWFQSYGPFGPLNLSNSSTKRLIAILALFVGCALLGGAAIAIYWQTHIQRADLKPSSPRARSGNPIQRGR